MFIFILASIVLAAATKEEEIPACPNAENLGLFLYESDVGRGTVGQITYEMEEEPTFYDFNCNGDECGADFEEMVVIVHRGKVSWYFATNCPYDD